MRCWWRPSTPSTWSARCGFIQNDCPAGRRPSFAATESDVVMLILPLVPPANAASSACLPVANITAHLPAVQPTSTLPCLLPTSLQVADLESQLAASSAEREEQRQLLAELHGSLAAAQEACDAAEARAAAVQEQVGEGG